MEKIEAIAAAAVLKTVGKPASATSIGGIFFLCIVLSWVSTLHDLYSFFRYLLRPLLASLFTATSTTYKKSNEEVPTPTTSLGKNLDKEKLLGGEVQMVMERLGIFCNLNGDKLQEGVGAEEVATMFEEEEPSLEEVKEAFEVFDENGDDHIDARELETVLCSLGFTQVSELECQRMIATFDKNEDGLIDFNEFVKLVEKGF